MILSISICLATFCWLVWMLRRDTVSLGLPIAYLFGLLLIHVPGAFAHLVGAGVLQGSHFTEIGIRFTAIGATCFVAGVWLARSRGLVLPPYGAAERERFWLFCLLAGWVFTYGLGPLGRTPSLGAAIEKGGAVWMLGVMMGLRGAAMRGDLTKSVLWLSALAVYPVLMLLFGGFLSYGATATTIVLSVLTISIYSHTRVAVGVIIASVLGFNLFLSYFQTRDEIRQQVWGGAALEERIDVSLNMFREFEWFDPADEDHLIALDERLNQNYFAGLAATRIENGQVDYLYGRSLWEALFALVPRAIWPDKPVFAGSPKIVSEMTGLVLSETTSFGVGNVMEFQINFGIPGLVVGFLLLGWLLGLLDRKAALADCRGDLGQVFLFFLPAVALIQPNGSLVELASGSAAALVAAQGWKWAWKHWVPQTAAPAMMPVMETGTSH
jgi:hypothetical protein